MGYLLIFSRRGRYRGDPLALAGLHQPVADAVRLGDHQRCARADMPRRLGHRSPRMVRVPGEPIAGSARETRRQK